MQFNGNIGLVGTGRMARALALAFENAGVKVQVIAGRNIDKAQEIAELLYETYATDNLDFREVEIDVLIIAVSDSAIEDVSNEIVLPEGAIIAHTSGSIGLEALSNHNDKSGVFYPLQSISVTNQINFKEVPICIEGATLKVHELLTSVAKTIGGKTITIDSEKRLSLHVAAVMASNFTNHLLFQASNILASSDLDLEILKPLMRHTLEKAFRMGPEQAQTGPAIRRDFVTLQKHYDYLGENHELLKLYKELTNSIIKNS